MTDKDLIEALFEIAGGARMARLDLEAVARQAAARLKALTQPGLLGSEPSEAAVYAAIRAAILARKGGSDAAKSSFKGPLVGRRGYHPDCGPPRRGAFRPCVAFRQSTCADRGVYGLRCAAAHDRSRIPR